MKFAWASSPRRETAGGFSYPHLCRARANVLARRQNPSAGSVRYYLWSEDRLSRVPDRLHYDLLDRVVSLPEFAGTRQKVIEVFIQPLTSTSRSITARGVIF